MRPRSTLVRVFAQEDLVPQAEHDDAGQVVWPDEKTMVARLWSFPGSQVARLMGVSYDALRRHLETFRSPLPPAGFWQRAEAHGYGYARMLMGLTEMPSEEPVEALVQDKGDLTLEKLRNAFASALRRAASREHPAVAVCPCCGRGMTEGQLPKPPMEVR